MCGPAAMVLGGALTAASSISQGMAASQAAKMNAAISESNAKVVAARGAFEESRIRDQVQKVLAGQQAYYANSGLDLTTGSPIAVAASSAAQGEVDALLTRQKGQADSEGLKLQAQQQLEQGRQARLAGFFGAGTALLSTYSNATRWGSLSTSAKDGQSVGTAFNPFGSYSNLVAGGLY